MTESMPAAPHTTFNSRYLPWLLLAVLLGVLLLLASVGYWRSSGVGPQVQVPMFYDAHYLFPRPWTQEQSTPGVPDPAPLAIYGKNSVSQSFFAGADNLARVGFYLAASDDGLVHVSLAAEDGTAWEADIATSRPSGEGTDPSFSGDEFSISFPPQADSKGKRYTLTLTAPGATADRPVFLHTVGGDRLGDSLSLNEFIRPGNLAIATYSKGMPGLWWFDALGEQLLPAIFRLRLQQYKPPQFKGDLFVWLLAITVGLSAALLVLSAPGLQTRQASFWRRLVYIGGWFLVILLGSFLLWQVGSGRAQLVAGTNDVATIPVSDSEPFSVGGQPRLAADLINDLWTAVRRPEARLVKTDGAPGYPAIIVPGDSRIEYSLIVPPGSRLRLAQATEGSGTVKFAVKVNEELLFDEEVAAREKTSSADYSWQELDLGPWAGQGVVLALETSLMDGTASGRWFMPQILTDASWVSTDPPDEYLPVNVRFGETAELLGVTMDETALQTEGNLGVQLLWQPLEENDRHGKVFVHLLDGADQLIAQHDATPVQGAYPFAVWQPGTIVKDEHLLQINPDALTSGPYRLAVGVYDPDTLERWTAEYADGTPAESGATVLEIPPEVLP